MCTPPRINMTEHKSVKDLAARLAATPARPGPGLGAVENPFQFRDAALQGQLDRGNQQFIELVTELVLSISRAKREGGFMMTTDRDAVWDAVVAIRRAEQGATAEESQRYRHIYDAVVDDVFAGNYLKKENRLI